MKKHSITLFGVPTLFTVLIVVLIISFSTLSYLNTLNVKHSIERGNNILVVSYTLQRDMELVLLDLKKDLDKNEFTLDNSYVWEYDQKNQLFTISKTQENLRLDVKLRVIRDSAIDFEVIEWKLISGNNQDYTQDGDPVYGG